MQKYECSICLEQAIPEKQVTLSCGHSFHHSCAIGWLMENNTCPMCRKSIGITTSTNRKTCITLYYNINHIIDFNDMNRIYDTMIDIISVDETDPDEIQWDSSNSIQYIIKGGRKNNKKNITYQISKHNNEYAVYSIDIDFWKYPTKKNKFCKNGNNRKYRNNKNGNNRKYGKKQFN